MSSIQAVFEQNFRSKWSLWAALGAGCLVGMSGILLIQRLSMRVEQVSSQSLSRELASLHSTLKKLQMEIQLIKKPPLKPAIRSVTFVDVENSFDEKQVLMNNSNFSSTTSTTEYFSAVSSDEEDDFFDIQTDTEPEDDNGGRQTELCQEVQRIREARELSQFFQTLDELMEGDAELQNKAFQMLKRREESLSDNCEFLWRLCKSMYLSAVVQGQQGKEDERKDLIFNAVDYGARAIECDKSSSEAHKWYAIVIGTRGEYLGIKEKILDGYEFKKHIDLAANLSPQDHTVRHLLGRFCYEVAELSWWERKVASTLFADPPMSTMEEARDHFLAAEEMKPNGWKENRQFLAKCYISLKDYAKAIEWLDKANHLPVNNPDDEQAQNDIDEMLKLYQSYR